LKLFLPVIRADILLFESYRCAPEPALDCPISAYSGASDHDVRDDHLNAWQEHTTSQFSTRQFPGDHFFVQSSEQPLVECIVNEINAQ
jgi:medium-chain acyl-[acyl-carrier-protein] hydrolase